MRILTIALMTFLLLAVSSCGQSVDSDGQPVGSGVHQYNPELDKDCMGCDLSGADLTHADLYGANLSHVDLSGAELYDADLTQADLTGTNLSHVDLSGANLDGVIGADFSRAKNVPPKYLKD